jgi:hypothetical protein
MDSSKLFDKFSEGDSDMQSARKRVSSATSVKYTLVEYIDTIYKNTSIVNTIFTNADFIEVYMIKTYVETDELASDEYVSKMITRIDTLINSIPKLNEHPHTYRFLNLYSNRTILSKETLVYLNDLYKGKLKP